MSLRSTARALAYGVGGFRTYHEMANKDSLTVVMFHRVLPALQMADADPGYTVSERLFSECLQFFQRYYSVVGIDQVRGAISGQAPLPSRALLITFDDGWDDNYEYAAPLLTRRSLPAVVFVSTDPIGEGGAWWWQEILLRAVRRQPDLFATLWRSAVDDAVPPADGKDRNIRLLMRFGALEPDIRWRVLGLFLPDEQGRHMLSDERVGRLPQFNIAIGSHGASHLPMTLLSDVEADLARSRSYLESVIPAAGQSIALSFPHGRYSPKVLTLARRCGYSPLFTSDPVINTLRSGRLASVLGRIEIPAHEISRTDGGLNPASLAAWLFRRPHRHLDGNEG